MMAYGWETAAARIALVRSGKATFRDMAPRHPYAAAAVLASELRAVTAVDGRFRPEDPATAQELAQFCATRLGKTPPLEERKSVTRGEFFLLAADLLGGGGAK